MNDLPKRVYLAGPMSGFAEHNFPLFNRVADWLRERGHEVFNPAENKDGGLRQTRAYYMRLDLPELLASEAVVVLPDWQQSRGASLEIWMALDLDLPIFAYADGDSEPTLRRATDIQLGRLPFLA